MFDSNAALNNPDNGINDLAAVPGNLFQKQLFTNRFHTLGSDFYSHQMLTSLHKPELIHINQAVANLLDHTTDELNNDQFRDFACGNVTLNQSQPIAAIYAGHQFGHFVPQLGDGRALLLGEIKNSRDEHWEMQLKGAVVVRMAPSFIRFGSFELFASRGQHEQVKKLADFVISHYYPEVLEQSLENYMAQIAIEKATEQQDYSEIDKLFTLMQSPYDKHPEMSHYAGLPPEWANEISVCCSS